MPSLTDYLGIETDKGLSDILAGRTLLNDSIIKLQPAGLHLLPGGEARTDVAELISGPTFKEILRQAREMFDYVIIDAPPLGIFTDATVSLLLSNSKSRLDEAAIKFIGVVSRRLFLDRKQRLDCRQQRNSAGNK
jgi:Mrp family chromosome partitioning ATPase